MSWGAASSVNVRNVRRYAPAVAVALPILWVLKSVLPVAGRQPFFETSLWATVLVLSFIGWGSLVAFVVARDERVDLGLRAAWGASVVIFVGGFLLAGARMHHDSAMALVTIGALLSLAALARERDAVQRRFAFAWRALLSEPRLALALAFVVALVVVHCMIGIAEWHTDPYDDDIAYLGFVKKLDQTGEYPEPFSFRRLSALGGQTLFVMLAALRAAPNQAHTFDRAVAMAMLALLILGHRARARRPAFLFTVVAVLLVPTLPLLARNTTAHYSAVAFFLGLFRTVVWAGNRERSAWRPALPIALVSLTLCTLRQNYLPVPALFLALSYGARALGRGRSIADRLLEPVLVGAITLLGLVPWFVASYQSNHTFLYPVVLGTFNPALLMRSETMTWFDELRVAIKAVIEGIPIHTIGFIVLGALFLRDGDRRKPLASFIVATLGGYLLLVHSLNQGDSYNLGRYAFGYVAAAAVATALSAGLVRFRAPFDRTHAAAALVLFSFVVQIGRSADGSYRFYARGLSNIVAARTELPRSKETERPQEETYKLVQKSVPEGERLAVLLDEPYWLNFKRNPIWNLDMPGYSSLAPGMPFFQGSDKLEAYFKQVGIRYLAFVRPDRSTYHYRRDYWVQLLLDEMEIWRTYAPYVINMVDNLGEIATRHRHLYDKDGIVVLDLAEGVP